MQLSASELAQSALARHCSRAVRRDDGWLARGMVVQILFVGSKHET